MELSAFHKYLLEKTKGDLDALIEELRHEAVENQNEEVINLLASTGDKYFTSGTFKKASNILLNEYNKSQ